MTDMDDHDTGTIDNDLRTYLTHINGEPMPQGLDERAANAPFERRRRGTWGGWLGVTILVAGTAAAVVIGVATHRSMTNTAVAVSPPASAVAVVVTSPHASPSPAATPLVVVSPPPRPTLATAPPSPTPAATPTPSPSPSPTPRIEFTSTIAHLTFSGALAGPLLSPMVTCVPLDGPASMAYMTVTGTLNGQPEIVLINGYDGESGAYSVITGPAGGATGLIGNGYGITGEYPASPAGLTQIDFSAGATMDVHLSSNWSGSSPGPSNLELAGTITC